MLLIRSFVRRKASQVGLPLKASAIAAAVFGKRMQRQRGALQFSFLRSQWWLHRRFALEVHAPRLAESGLPGPDGGAAAPADGAYVPPRPGRGVEVAALPEARRRRNSAPLPSHKPKSRRPAMAPTNTTPPAAAGPHPIKAGEQIEVQHGDTLYGLSKRHHVSVAGS